jgi:hypothetical protein
LIESPNDTRADILAVCDRGLGGLSCCEKF